ncbi:hypothetical protein DFJ77DRAFT_509957 [Powellomyces hirtus]|nr:hypothetical protein DFJ77DRAFT_509957 [Powellomyces hirtus]
MERERGRVVVVDEEEEVKDEADWQVPPGLTPSRAETPRSRKRKLDDAHPPAERSPVSKRPRTRTYLRQSVSALGSVLGVVSLIVEVVMLVLLSDRIVGLKHRPTRWTFGIAVATSILFDLLNVVGNKVPWFFDLAGSFIYYWGRGVFAATNQWAVFHLLYLRTKTNWRLITSGRLWS